MGHSMTILLQTYYLVCGEKIRKIGQHLVQLYVGVYWLVFFHSHCRVSFKCQNLKKIHTT